MHLLGGTNMPAVCVCFGCLQGNVARFFNHSCDPNCLIQTVLAKGARWVTGHDAFATVMHLASHDAQQAAVLKPLATESNSCGLQAVLGCRLRVRVAHVASRQGVAVGCFGFYCRSHLLHYIVIVTSEDIPKDTELTYDYGSLYIDVSVVCIR